jgi:hypothetical protein
MRRTWITALALAAGLAFAGCSGASGGGSAMMKCDGCKTEAPKDKLCPKDGNCASCDKCPRK